MHFNEPIKSHTYSHLAHAERRRRRRRRIKYQIVSYLSDLLVFLSFSSSLDSPSRCSESVPSDFIGVTRKEQHVLHRSSRGSQHSAHWTLGRQLARLALIRFYIERFNVYARAPIRSIRPRERQLHQMITHSTQTRRKPIKTYKCQDVCTHHIAPKGIA